MKRDLELLRTLMFELEENYWERGQLARIRVSNKINAGEPPALPDNSRKVGLPTKKPENNNKLRLYGMTKNKKELVYVTE